MADKVIWAKKDEIIWANVLRMQAEKKWSDAELARRAKTTPQAIVKYNKHHRGIGPGMQKRFAEAFGFPEEALLKEATITTETTDAPRAPLDMNSLIKIIEEQNKRIEEQGKRIDEQSNLILTQKDLIHAQGERISDQGKRIDLVAAMASKSQSDTDFLRDRVASIQDAINQNHAELKSKMKKASETGDLKALGE
ncbi:MAG: hypothetical protein CVU71_03795 [Deltaproteobacteria bacterium HGW-Deltaproteobacteria-6]|jgi:transcriptional regulator with XRE-family HTH domain|nr:MAG: hypothetical protein CVU71_03795 [Deltaproteobacteria bacterium HGW-Deltaproteobacteria-6]